MEDDVYGIPTPSGTAAFDPTLLLVPCVGFGPGGLRLGSRVRQQGWRCMRCAYEFHHYHELDVTNAREDARSLERSLRGEAGTMTRA